jgi:hypothetical protein
MTTRLRCASSFLPTPFFVILVSTRRAGLIMCDASIVDYAEPVSVLQELVAVLGLIRAVDSGSEDVVE